MIPADMLSAALSLPPRERAELAYALLVSLGEEGGDAPQNPGEIDAAWGEEVERRAASIVDGTGTLVDWGVVRAGISARLKERRGAGPGR